MVFERDRIKRKGPGRYQLRLRPTERMLVGELVGSLREQLLASTDEPSVRRLFPPAYPDDPERDAGYQVLTRDELLEQRLAAIDTMERTLRSDHVTEDELLAWLAALNDVRLVLGVRLAVTEEATVADFAGDPEAERAYDLYRYLSYLEEHVVDALSS